MSACNLGQVTQLPFNVSLSLDFLICNVSTAVVATLNWSGASLSSCVIPLSQL